MADQIFIQHRFTIEKDGLSYSDAIVVPQDEYQKLDASEIEQIKLDRFSSWKYIIENPAQEPEMTKEEETAFIDASLASLEEQKQILISKKQELESATIKTVVVEKVK